MRYVVLYLARHGQGQHNVAGKLLFPPLSIPPLPIPKAHVRLRREGEGGRFRKVLRPRSLGMLLGDARHERQLHVGSRRQALTARPCRSGPHGDRLESSNRRRNPPSDVSPRIPALAVAVDAGGDVVVNRARPAEARVQRAVEGDAELALRR